MKNRITKLLCDYYRAREVCVIALVLGLVTGLLDVTINVSSGPSGLSSFSAVLPPLTATSVFVFLIYIVLWFLLARHIGSLFKLEAIPLAVSFSSFLGTALTLVSLNGLIYSPLSQTDSFKLYIALLISLLVSIGAYFTTKVVTNTPQYKKTASVFMLSIPFVIAEIALFFWFYTYRVDSFFHRIPSFLVTIVGALIVLSTIGLFRFIDQKISVLKLLFFFTVIVILSPLTPLTRDHKNSPLEVKQTDNRIRNVILLTVDTLRIDALSCYDSKSVSTPHIDRLARDGILFKNAISPAPWTLPSISSIMTGLSPSIHLATRMNSQLPNNLLTLAERMRDAGYFTAAIVSNGFLSPQSNVSQGFLEYDFFPRYPIGNSLGVKLLRWILPNEFMSDASTSDITELAIRWLESNHERDFFLWIHYYDPHIPYSPPADFLPKGEPPPAIGTSFSEPWQIRGGNFTPSLAERRWIEGLYHGEVRYVDENIGRLLDTLKRLGLYDSSLIIFTSDHGEEFWEHGGYEHGHSLYNEVLRVPLIIKPPMSNSYMEINKAVSTLSITPTVLDLCGIEHRGDYFSAASLSPLWGKNPNDFGEKPIMSTGLLYYEDRESVVFHGLKYIRSLVTGKEELYDLTRDPEERVSISDSSPDKVERARTILREYDRVAKEVRNGNNISSPKGTRFDEETKKNLKALGYIQ
jgi:arylsulfatase A-like enzyme